MTAPSSTWWRSWSTSGWPRPWPQGRPTGPAPCSPSRSTRSTPRSPRWSTCPWALPAGTLSSTASAAALERCPGRYRAQSRSPVDGRRLRPRPERAVEAALYFCRRRGRPERRQARRPPRRSTSTSRPTADEVAGWSCATTAWVRRHRRHPPARPRQHARPDRRGRRRHHRARVVRAGVSRSRRSCRTARLTEAADMSRLSDSTLAGWTAGRGQPGAHRRRHGHRGRVDAAVLDPVGRHPRLAARRHRLGWQRGPRCGDRRGRPSPADRLAAQRHRRHHELVVGRGVVRRLGARLRRARSHASGRLRRLAVGVHRRRTRPRRALP